MPWLLLSCEQSQLTTAHLERRYGSYATSIEATASRLCLKTSWLTAPSKQRSTVGDSARTTTAPAPEHPVAGHRGRLSRAWTATTPATDRRLTTVPRSRTRGQRLPSQQSTVSNHPQAETDPWQSTDSRGTSSASATSSATEHG